MHSHSALALYKCFGMDFGEWIYFLSECTGISTSRILIGDFNIKSLQKAIGILFKYPKGYPYQYILRKSVFYGREFYVDERVMIPRSDTERLVDIVLPYLRDGFYVLDLCAGSGVIGITLKLLFPGITVFLSDISREALKVAEINVKKFGIDANIIACDLLKCFKRRFDIIVSNPPYIPEDMLGRYDRRLFYEPRISLVGGRYGYEITKKLIEEARLALKEGGYLFIESDPMHFHIFPKNAKFIDRFVILRF